MAESKSFNLFAYGTLMNASVFRAVLGRRLVMRRAEADGVEVFHARRAVLNGHKKISPDNTYLYAVPSRQGRIRGYIVGPLPNECMAALRHYEGKNYMRRTVRVQTAAGAEKAVVFLGRPEKMTHSFGYEFRDHFKQEVILDRKIDAVLLETEREHLHTTDDATRRAVAELRGDRIRDLRRRHFEAGGVSDYAIRHVLKETPLPDFTRVQQDPEARALADNYLAIVVRQVIFNEIEEHIFRDFRYELDRMDRGHVYYERTTSSLTALRLLNAQPLAMHALVDECQGQLSFDENHLVDFVRWAVKAADRTYDLPSARAEIEFIRNHMGAGYTPLGAELEFSNIGHAVIRDPKGQAVRDARYDGFLYFRDFGLDALTWRLGGHLDDHHEKASSRPRRGFFEVALGNLSIEANLSKPITDDPWLLNQLIHQARRFYDITPHSVHISMQARSRRKPVRDRLLPLAVVKCLFAIAGDPGSDEDGRIVIRRLLSDEIMVRDGEPHMLFSELSKRHSSDADGPYPAAPHVGGRYVQQFKFLRLAPHLNYEPIIMALKGLQIRLSPGSFLRGSQYSTSRRHRRLFDDCTAWGAKPEPLPVDEIETFLSAVYEGLMTERRGKPAHSGAYIAWSINELRKMLAEFNTLVAKAPPPPADA